MDQPIGTSQLLRSIAQKLKLFMLHINGINMFECGI